MSVAVIAGAAQIVQRPHDVDLAAARGPIELMVDAARAASEDAGAPALLQRLGWIGVAGGWFRHRNPAQLVGERIGSPGARTALTTISGTAPQDLLGLAAERISNGELDVALVVGGEARWSYQRLKRSGERPSWTTEEGDGLPETLPGFPSDLLEETRALGSTTAAYALFDDSMRRARGETVDDRRDRVAALWARFSAVAAENPYAWDRTPKTAIEVREASATNRMISFPYTKAMVANNSVDMSSALLLCSVDAALGAGVARERLVFPHVVASSHETWKVVSRQCLHGVPALATAGRAALHHVGLAPDDIAHVDLYACFPAIVEMSAAALGLDTERPLTLTGGLGFAGAAIGNAVGHSIAAMVSRAREGGYGLVHGNGGNATKHSFAVYSNEPPKAFARLDCQAMVEHHERTELPEDWTGEASVEAATVVYDREGPSHVLAGVLSKEGARGWATSRDAHLIATATSDGISGLRCDRSREGELRT